MRSSSSCRSALAAGIAIAWLAGPVRALDPERALSQYIHNSWGADRGFPGGPVHGFAQTGDGYLWIAAEKGLVRFDGFAFRLFEPHELVPNSRAIVRGIAADPGGGLWARLRGPALLRYRHEAFEHVASAIDRPDVVLTALTRGRDGSILFAVLGQGVQASRAGGLVTIVEARAMPAAFVTAIAESSDGDLWLGTRDAGLLRVRAGRVTPFKQGLPDLKINCLLAGKGQDLWIGTDAGTVRWNAGALRPVDVPPALGREVVNAMLEDRDGNTWLATASGGLLRVDPRGIVARLGSDRKPATPVTALFEDRDGNLWVGTTRGIERLRDGAFATFSTAQGLPSNRAGPVFVDSAQRTWFGPAEGGLYWLRDERITRVTAAGLDGDVIYSIAGDEREVWVGRQKGGLTRLRVTGDAVAAERFTEADGLAQNSVYAVYRARDGAVWAGTLSAGVSRVKAGAFTTYTSREGLASNTVASILETADGGMWFATPSGVSLLSRSGWRRYSTSEGLPSNDVNTLVDDSTGKVWAGTAAGLAVFKSGAWRSPGNVPAALRGSILGLADDRAGGMWIVTAERVMRANRERLESGGLGAEDLQEYGTADGLLGLDGVKRHRSVVLDARGRTWISTNGGGLSMAAVRHAADRGLPALVHIGEVSADGRPVGAAVARPLPPRPQRVTFSYVGLSLSVPERMMFRYRLDGFDTDWSAPVAARQVAYTNLGPGPYRFRVKASNSTGAWNGEEAGLAFHIAPVFWQTRGFQIAVVLLLAVAGWGVYRLRLRQVARRLNSRFEERLAERTRIAQDLHDTLLQGFVSASMQLHVAADRLPADSDARPSLARVLDLMGRVIEDGRNAVRGLRASATAGADLEQALSGIPEELALAGQATYQLVVEGRRRPLNPLIRDEVYRIGREAVVNAFRHSGARAIEVEIEYGSSALRLLVRDDGRGIDATVLQEGSEGHWGLPGMRERAERIGARVKVWSRASAGTEIELTVPGAVAFSKAGKKAS